MNVLLAQEYPDQYTAAVRTRVSNFLLVGQISGQIIIGLTCDYLGRKTAIIATTLMIVVGGILATAASGITVGGLFWMMTIARGIIGFGTGGKMMFCLSIMSFTINDLFEFERNLFSSKN